MKYLFIFLLAIMSAICSYAQCERSTPFTADFLFQTNGKNLNSALNFGFFNNIKLSAQLGARIYDSQHPEKANEQKVSLVPTATVLIKHRFNGDYSKLVHALGITAGASNYKEVSYRIYGAPDGYSFATIGGTASFSNIQGFTVGFVIMAIF